MNKIKVGFIGCGMIAKERHVKELASNPNVEMVAFCDIIKERAYGMAETHGGDVYTDYHDLLKRKDIDAVFVLCCNNLHAEITIDSLNAGKHTLCEKPMAITEQQCIDMIAASKKNNKLLMIGHNQRLLPAHIRAKEIIASGKFGKVITFRTTFGHKGCEHFSYGGLSTWFFKKEPSGFGTCADLGVHKADLLRFLLGEKIVLVSAFAGTLAKRNETGNFIEVDDNAVCLLKTESGAIGTLTASWTYADEDNSTMISLEEAMIKIYPSPDVDIEITHKDGQVECFSMGGVQTNENQFKSGIPDEFVNAIIEARQPQISSAESMEAVKVIIACLESSEKGCAISINKGCE